MFEVSIVCVCVVCVFFLVEGRGCVFFLCVLLLYVLFLVFLAFCSGTLGICINVGLYVCFCCWCVRVTWSYIC